MELRTTEAKADPVRFFWGNGDDAMWIDMSLRPAIEAVFSEVGDKNLTALKLFNLFQRPKGGYTSEQLERIHMVFDKSICDWGNITVDGENLDCTFLNKLRMVEQVEGFMNFYMKSLQKLIADYQKNLEAIGRVAHKEKNAKGPTAPTGSTMVH